MAASAMGLPGVCNGIAAVSDPAPIARPMNARFPPLSKNPFTAKGR